MIKKLTFRYYGHGVTLGNVIDPEFYIENYHFSTQILTAIRFN